MKMASLVLGTAADQYGCFVPDLTRFLGTACEGTRQAQQCTEIRRFLQNILFYAVENPCKHVILVLL